MSQPDPNSPARALSRQPSSSRPASHEPPRPPSREPGARPASREPPRNGGADGEPLSVVSVVPVMPGRITSAYDVQKAVGKGGYAVVYKAVRRDDGRVVAVKKVEVSSDCATTACMGMLADAMRACMGCVLHAHAHALLESQAASGQGCHAAAYETHDIHTYVCMYRQLSALPLATGCGAMHATACPLASRG